MILIFAVSGYSINDKPTTQFDIYQSISEAKIAIQDRNTTHIRENA